MRSSSENKRLTKQYMMDPSISQFVSENFYEGRLEDDSTVKSDDYNKLLKEFPVPAYGFFDISGVDELTGKGKGFVESSVIMFLLQFVCKGIHSFLLYKYHLFLKNRICCLFFVKRKERNTFYHCVFTKIMLCLGNYMCFIYDSFTSFFHCRSDKCHRKDQCWNNLSIQQPNGCAEKSFRHQI